MLGERSGFPKETASFKTQKHGGCMKCKWLKAICAIALIASVSDCVAVKTRVVEVEPTVVPSDDRDGIIYRLPLQGIVLTLTVTKGVRDVSVEPTSVYPDMTRTYVAQYHRSYLTTNSIDLSVTNTGLLTGQISAQVSPLLGNIFDAIVKAGGTTTMALGNTETDEDELLCQADGTYRWVIQVPQPASDPGTASALKCGINVDATALGFTSDKSRDENYKGLALNGTGREYEGIFYRQAIPYHITTMDGVTSNGNQKKTTIIRQSIQLLVTKDSPIEFISLQRSFFAKNDFNLTFDNGSPTVYHHSIDSEWVGLLTAPAQLVKEYMAAVGAVFTARKGAVANESEYYATVAAASATKAKADACLAAVSRHDMDSANLLCAK